MSYFGVSSVTVKGTTPIMLIKEITLQWAKVKDSMEVVAVAAVNAMRSHIIAMSNRGTTGRLEKAIGIEWADENTIGVGNIEFLNQVAPYWYILNYGGRVSAAQKGKAVPGFFGEYNAPDSSLAGSNVGTERFNYRPYTATTDEGNAFFMRPKNPILPRNYVEKGLSVVLALEKIHFSGFSGRYTLRSK